MIFTFATFYGLQSSIVTAVIFDFIVSYTTQPLRMVIYEPQPSCDLVRFDQEDNVEGHFRVIRILLDTGTICHRSHFCRVNCFAQPHSSVTDKLDI